MGVHRNLNEGFGVVVRVHFKIVDHGQQGMSAEGVVGRLGLDRVLEVDVKLVHAGRVVNVGHHLVSFDPEFLKKFFAR